LQIFGFYWYNPLTEIEENTMKQGIHPKTHLVTVVCSTCKTSYEVLSTADSIKVEMCSHCHPFYTGEQKIIDTANKVKDFERRKEGAATRSAQLQKAKERRPNRVTEVKADRPLTLRDMLKSVQG
jgi:large subunit ribosomal protein L31